MLNLTVLRRYRENGRSVCEELGEMFFEYQKGKVINNNFICAKMIGTFQEKYPDIKDLLYEIFMRKKTLEKAIKAIRKKGLKIQKVEFGDDEGVQIVVLIEE